MGEITLYKVGLSGDVVIQADNEDDAKTEALAYFSQDPSSHLVILQVTTAIVPED